MGCYTYRLTFWLLVSETHFSAKVGAQTVLDEREIIAG